MNAYYEVLTENGFKDFLTISVKIVKEYLLVEFTNGKSISCTLNHKFKVGDVYKVASELVIGDVLSPNSYSVSALEVIQEAIEVYDLVDVVDGNNYLTNDVTSHNCQFLSSDHTLFDSYYITQAEQAMKRKLEEYVASDPNRHHPNYVPAYPYRVAGHKFWKKLEPSKTYIVGVDPATGSGEDFTVFQVFEFPSLTQVLEYRTNSMSSPVAYTQLKNLLKFLEQFTKDVYFSIENNGVGNGMISLYEADEDAPKYAHFVSEPGQKKLGMFTSASTKIKSALKFKELFERNQMTIHSDILFHEMKNFVRREGSYAANPGAHDDCISAVLIVFRILQEMATYDENAYAKMYTVEAEIEVENTWSYSDEDRDSMREREEYDDDEAPLPFFLS